MPVQTGSQFPYPEFRKRHVQERPAPILWQWENLAKELAAADHTEYGTLTLATPDGDHQVVPGTSMTFQSVRPGEHTTPHTHSWWHLYFVRSGSGALVFDETEETVRLSGGDIMLIPAWHVHHFENNESGVDLLLLNMSNLPQLATLHNKFSKEYVSADIQNEQQ
ncbi:cupin domain-containing protein [Streptomyces sp. NRRL F-2799]|uniref:cupin domain-containing protein n=1 Tax=Streptomyces sp. NRRL F-2799 TaxID=1463844 RepID=UPI00131A5320|nr:cupin domain-containing protein [Streptomyces sp. NRRL F-2799]